METLHRTRAATFSGLESNGNDNNVFESEELSKLLRAQTIPPQSAVRSSSISSLSEPDKSHSDSAKMDPSHWFSWANRVTNPKTTKRKRRSNSFANNPTMTFPSVPFSLSREKGGTLTRETTAEFLKAVLIRGDPSLASAMDVVPTGSLRDSPKPFLDEYGKADSFSTESDVVVMIREAKRKLQLQTDENEQLAVAGREIRKQYSLAEITMRTTLSPSSPSSPPVLELEDGPHGPGVTPSSPLSTSDLSSTPMELSPILLPEQSPTTSPTDDCKLYKGPNEPQVLLSSSLPTTRTAPKTLSSSPSVEQATAYRLSMVRDAVDVDSFCSPQQRRSHGLRDIKRSLEIQLKSVLSADKVVAAQQERDRDRERLEEVLSTGAGKKVADELLAIREIWIDAFGQEAFDLDKLKQKFRSLEHELATSEIHLQDAFHELLAVREKNTSAETDFDHHLHELEATINADKNELKQLRARCTHAQKEQNDLQQALKTAVSQIDLIETALKLAMPRLELLVEERQAVEQQAALVCGKHADITHTLETIETTANTNIDLLEQTMLKRKQLDELYKSVQFNIEISRGNLAEFQSKHDADLESRRATHREALASQDIDAILFAIKELELELFELETAMAITTPQLQSQKQRYQVALTHLATQIECAADGTTDDLQAMFAALKASHTIELAPLREHVNALSLQLHKLLTENEMSKRTVQDNALVLEHLSKRMAEMDSEITFPTEVSRLRSAAPDTSMLVLHSNLEMNQSHPLKNQAVGNALHIAVEEAIECSRFESIIRQTSLAIRVTVTKRKHLQEWCRANALRTWLPDHKASTCGDCDAPFTFFLRRHHCRVCGRIFCNQCSQERIVTSRKYNAVRCCLKCHDEINALSFDMVDDGDGNFSEEDDDDDDEDDNHQRVQRQLQTLELTQPRYPSYECYGCKTSLAHVCYSPTCRWKINEESLDFNRQVRFHALVLEIKLKCSMARHAADEMYVYSVRHRIKEESWPDFLYKALCEGLPSFRLQQAT